MSNASLSSFSILPASHVGKPPYHRTSSQLDLRYQTFFTNYILTLISHIFSVPSSSNTEPFSGSSNDASESYGTQSAGYDNNIERTGGEEGGSKGGVKGALGKIKDKLAPSGQGQSRKVDEVC